MDENEDVIEFKNSIDFLKFAVDEAIGTMPDYLRVLRDEWISSNVHIIKCLARVNGSEMYIVLNINIQK